jgi:hypothetical protein
MSEYTTVELEINDPECLKASLTELGYVFEEHETAQHLYGYQGDKRQQKAHVIIRRKYVGSMSNDVGFLRKEDGTYELIISDYDRSGSKKQAKNLTQALKQVYATHKIKKKAKALGYTVKSQKTTDGKVKIRVMR